MPLRSSQAYDLAGFFGALASLKSKSGGGSWDSRFSALTYTLTNMDALTKSIAMDALDDDPELMKKIREAAPVGVTL